MKKLILALMLIIPAISYADSLYLGLYTDHFVKGSLNETNSVIMVQLNSGLTIGTMTNSYDKTSVMLGYVQPNKPIALGIVFATGYEPKDFYLEDYLDSTPIVPFPLLSANINITDHVAITANLIGGIVFNAGLTFSF